MNKKNEINRTNNDNNFQSYRNFVIEIERNNIEKSINIEATQDTESYYSNRYGWTLRKIIS